VLIAVPVLVVQRISVVDECLELDLGMHRLAACRGDLRPMGQSLHQTQAGSVVVEHSA
jgi:hypothetical protein